MKIIQVIIYFSFFVLTYCDLIPNNRVITDSNSQTDFNLVEGITYKIVHLRTGLNLNSNDDGISLNSVPSYWVLWKSSDNQYNIINAKSGLNLDSDGRRVYISKPEDNYKFNLYQNWIFTKVKDNIYNIVHVKFRNLDSNGKDVYISTPKDNSKTNTYQQWLFEPSNYNLTALVMDMKYPPDLEDNLEQYKSHTALLSCNSTIENDSNAILEQTIDETELKSNSYTLEIKKSKSFKVTKNVNLSFSIGNQFFSLFNLLGIRTSFTAGIKHEFSSKYEEVYRESVTESVSYHIRKKIMVPPFSSVRLSCAVDKINIILPFSAKIRITGKADRLDENGIVVSMTNVEVNALRCYLSKENYDIKNITIEGNSLLIDTVGTLEVDGYGLVSKIRTDNITFPNNSASLKDYLLYLFLFALPIISFISYKLYLNRSNRKDYQSIL